MLTGEREIIAQLYDPQQLVRFIDAVSEIGAQHGWVYRRAVKDGARIRLADKPGYYLQHGYVDRLKAELRAAAHDEIGARP